jgi:hypothetical protein
MNYFFIPLVALIAGVNAQTSTNYQGVSQYVDHHPFGSPIGHIDQNVNPFKPYDEFPSTGFGHVDQNVNPFIQQLVLFKLLEDSVTKFQTAFNTAASTSDKEGVMQTYASFFLMIGKLLPEGPYGSYYPPSYSVQKLSLLSGGNPYIERLILKKILEDTIGKYLKDITAASNAEAQKKECKAYMNRILLIGKIFGL